MLETRIKPKGEWTAQYASERRFKRVHAHSCLTLWDPVCCTLPGSSVHGVLQARILEWVAISFSMGIFLTWGSNPGLLHCRQNVYNLSYRKSWFSPLGVPNIAGSTYMHTNAQTRITDFNTEGWPMCHENQRTELLSGGKVFMESWLWVRCFREGCKDN